MGADERTLCLILSPSVSSVSSAVNNGFLGIAGGDARFPACVWGGDRVASGVNDDEKGDDPY